MWGQDIWKKNNLKPNTLGDFIVALNCSCFSWPKNGCVAK